MGIRAVGKIDGICDVMLDNSPFILYTKLPIFFFFFQKTYENVGPASRHRFLQFHRLRGCP